MAFSSGYRVTCGSLTAWAAEASAASTDGALAEPAGASSPASDATFLFSGHATSTLAIGTTATHPQTRTMAPPPLASTGPPSGRVENGPILRTVRSAALERGRHPIPPARSL